MVLGNMACCPKKTTGCECEPETFPHFCTRHLCLKAEHFVGLCRTKKSYFDLWERGEARALCASVLPGFLVRNAGPTIPVPCVTIVHNWEE
jgi:hypothetical protein